MAATGTKSTAAKTPLWKNSTVLITTAVAAVALAGGATFALWPKNYDKVVQELAQKGPEEIRKAVEAGQVPREVAWEAFGAAREAEFQQRIDGYFALKSPLDRNKFLDKLIDEQMARMREFESRRAEWERRATTRPAGKRRGDRPATQPSEERRREMEQRRATRADSTPPAQRAQRVEFMAAMRKRMQERGIEMPQGGRGFGGFGGGRGDGPGRGGGGQRGN